MRPITSAPQLPLSALHELHRRWASVLFAILAVSPACAPRSESRQVADRFVELYYARMSVAEAVKLCAGGARAKLESELRAIQGVPPDAPSGEPRVTITLTTSDTPSATQATYSYRITPHTSDVGKVMAVLTLTNEGGHWLVTSFDESEGPPPS
jgi:hypothetical protein